MSKAERWASLVLQVGGVTAVLIMSLGMIGIALGRVHGAETIRSIAQLRTMLAQRPIDPRAISVVGFLVLCETPFVAVVSAGVAFYRDDDRRFAIISALVAAGLLVGLWIGSA